jgi:hypothetical protein
MPARPAAICPAGGVSSPKAGERPALRSSMRAFAHAGAGISEIGLEGSLARRHAAKTNRARIVKTMVRERAKWKPFFVSRADHLTSMRFGHTRPSWCWAWRGVPTHRFLSFAGVTGRAGRSCLTALCARLADDRHDGQVVDVCLLSAAPAFGRPRPKNTPRTALRCSTHAGARVSA